MSKFVIDKEPAQDQLDLLLDFYEIELDDFEDFSSDDDKVQEAMRTACKRLLRFIMKGYVEITNDDGLTIIQHLKFSRGETKEIQYRIINGKAFMSMKRAHEKDFFGRMYCLLGSLANVPAEKISEFRGADASVATCLGAVFLTT